MKINTKQLFEYTLACGVAFFIGVFTTMYKIDQRVWNENINKATDIRYFTYLYHFTCINRSFDF